MKDDPIQYGRTDFSSMDGWYGYRPGLRFDRVGDFSASVSPGYWRYHDDTPNWLRDPDEFERAVEKLAGSTYTSN